MQEFLNIFKGTRKHLMNGVSYMIPFVVAAGVMMAVAVMMNGKGAAPTAGFAGQLWKIGTTGLGYMVPILSAYIAMSIADRPGIAPGMVGGAISTLVGAGFLGGIVTGLFAGVLCYYLKKIPLPRSLSSLKSIIIIPLVATFLTGGLMMWVIGVPIASFMTFLTHWLTSMSSTNRVVLGIICGAMTAFDMGGPVNKVSYAFAVATVASGVYTYAGPEAAAICIPPLGMAVATFIAPKKFTAEEREAGKGALAMGAVGITEGAIPFAANDPLRVIPCLMAGSAVGAALAFLFNTTNSVAWGGFIVLPVIGNKLQWVLSVVVGVAVVAALIILVKKPVKESAPGEQDAAAETSGKGDDISITIG